MEERRRRGADGFLQGLSGEVRVWAFVTLIAGLALALFFGATFDLHRLDAPIDLPLWAMIGLFYVAELSIVHFQLEREAQHITLSEIPLVLGLFFAAPVDVVIAQVIGAGLALGVHRRQSAPKLAFNLSAYALETCLALLVFHAYVHRGNALEPAGWLGTFAATFTASFVSVQLVAMAISVSEKKMRLTLGIGVAFATVATLANTSLTMLGVAVLWTRPETAVLLVPPAAVLFLAYRAYMGQRRQRESLEQLYESTRGTQQYLESGSAIRALLNQARQMFRAEIAQITLFEEGEDVGSRTSLGPGDALSGAQEVKLNPREGVWARVAAEGKAILLPRPIANDRLRVYFAARGIRKDVMVAPLFGKGGVIGTLTVGDRLGDVTTFDPEDLKLFETLANHASVSLENARLVDRLKESLAHLTEMNRLKDDFVAAVSHELRTPLTSIQGYVKTLLRPEIEQLGAEERRSFLESIDRSGERLRVLIEDLLVVARLEASELEATSTQVSLGLVAEQVIGELGDRLANRDVTVNFSEDVIAVDSDPGKLHQIVSNLVENAAKYSPAGRPIAIEGAMEGQGVTVTVRDHGTGIAPEEHAKIFERFYQVDGSMTREQGGTGLGLYLCRRLGESIGGRVWLQSSGPQGSVFALWVPLSFSPPATPATALDLDRG